MGLLRCTCDKTKALYQLPYYKQELYLMLKRLAVCCENDGPLSITKAVQDLSNQTQDPSKQTSRPF